MNIYDISQWILLFFIIALPEWLLHGIVGICFIALGYDVMISVREAIALKKFIEAQMEHNERLKRNPRAGARKHLIDFDEIKRILEKELMK